MSDYIRTPLDTDSSEFQGSVLRGILGSVVGMAACVLVLLLCWLVNFNSLMILLQMFVGTVIGWFYRLFHGRRSKSAAYVVVGVCTMLTCLFWMPVLAAIRLSGEIPLSSTYSDICYYNRNSIYKITCKTWGETRRRELMLYDPTFKDRIID